MPKLIIRNFNLQDHIKSDETARDFYPEELKREVLNHLFRLNGGVFPPSAFTITIPRQYGRYVKKHHRVMKVYPQDQSITMAFSDHSLESKKEAWNDSNLGFILACLSLLTVSMLIQPATSSILFEDLRIDSLRGSVEKLKPDWTRS